MVPEQRQKSSGVQTPVVWPKTLQDSLQALVAFSKDQVHLLLVLEASQRPIAKLRRVKQTTVSTFILVSETLLTN